MTERTVQFKVLRYKSGQATPTYQMFDLAVDEDTTVLVALQDIRRDQDPTLLLRHSCHHASCGTCGMRVNGREVLACVVKVLDLGTSTVLVEPLDNLRRMLNTFTRIDDVGDLGPYWSIQGVRDEQRPKWILFEETPAGEWKIAGI